MLVSDLRGNVKLTAGRNPSSFRPLKYRTTFFFLLKDKTI